MLLYTLPSDLIITRIGRRNDKDFDFKDNGKTWLTIKEDGTIIVRKGYSWNGCSPRISVLDLFSIGTPNGVVDHTGLPMTYEASCVHDALYQFLFHPNMPYSRCEADYIFLELMWRRNFGLRYPYFMAVRLFGSYMYVRRWIIEHR